MLRGVLCGVLRRRMTKVSCVVCVLLLAVVWSVYCGGVVAVVEVSVVGIVCKRMGVVLRRECMACVVVVLWSECMACVVVV